jgi:NAD(P)-dependent dehydrogenase (short-subunit alcohol dehydrogenase family)
MSIFGVHLDTRATLPRAHSVIADIEAAGTRAEFFNINAADARKRSAALDRIAIVLAGEQTSHIHFVLHSLAFGSLGPFIASRAEDEVDEGRLDMTLRVMANSLVYWVQDLVRRGLLARGSRVYALSSGGAERVSPLYAAVSAAKAALESHVRQLAVELGPKGIAVNALRPGVTDTPALRAIPGHEPYVEEALRLNPGGRLTTPEDIAVLLAALAEPRITWLTGAVIPVDGGELIVG